MSAEKQTREDKLRHEVEHTRAELSETVDELVHKVDKDVKSWMHTLREYRVPIALFALWLVLALTGRSGRTRG